MFYFLSPSTDPYYNLSIEELLYKKYTHVDVIVILWINSPSVIIGKYQNPWSEVNLCFTEDKGIPIIRRISGGGTVYHDLNNLNFTVIKNQIDNEPLDLKEFTTPIHTLLHKLGVHSTRSERGDILIDGKKICGTAQAFKKKRMLYHGCLLFDSVLDDLRQALKPSIIPTASKAVSSVKSPVDNILPHLKSHMTIADFRDLLLDEYQSFYGALSSYHPSEEENDEIKDKLSSRYKSWEWNFGQTPTFTAQFENATNIAVTLEIRNGLVKNQEYDAGNGVELIGRKFTPELLCL